MLSQDDREGIVLFLLFGVSVICGIMIMFDFRFIFAIIVGVGCLIFAIKWHFGTVREQKSGKNE